MATVLGTQFTGTLFADHPRCGRRARYNVRVHVDTSGSYDITAGDRISTVAHPVLTQGNPDNIVIEARRI